MGGLGASEDWSRRDMLGIMEGRKVQRKMGRIWECLDGMET